MSCVLFRSALRQGGATVLKVGGQICKRSEQKLFLASPFFDLYNMGPVQLQIMDF